MLPRAEIRGTLIFKWNENDVPVSQILALTPERPLFGNRCGKNAKSHWVVFLKPSLRNIAIRHGEDGSRQTRET